MLTDEQRKALEWAIELGMCDQVKAPGRRDKRITVLRAMLAASAAPADGREAVDEPHSAACLAPGGEGDEYCICGAFQRNEARRAALATAPKKTDDAKPKVESALRILMGAINAYEKETGVGGWYAERVQETSNYLLKAMGSEVRFGSGYENPVAASPTMIERIDRAEDKGAKS